MKLWRCALLISNSLSLDMLKLVRASASHHQGRGGGGQGGRHVRRRHHRGRPRRLHRGPRADVHAEAAGGGDGGSDVEVEAEIECAQEEEGPLDEGRVGAFLEAGEGFVLSGEGAAELAARLASAE